MKVWSIAVFVLFASGAFAQQTPPELPFDSVPDFFKLPPGMNFGEVSGVAVNSKVTSLSSPDPRRRTAPPTRRPPRSCSSSMRTAHSPGGRKRSLRVV